jgi:hypothetical protein
MIVNDKPNPFRILGLPTNAGNDEIVSHGRELYETVDTDEKRLLIRWAMEQLITHPLTRLEYELFEVPGTQYDDSDWERFLRNHRRNPIDVAALARKAPQPRPEDFDLGKLPQMILEDLLSLPPVDVSAALDHAPFEAGFGPPPLEVRDVLFG